MLVPCTLAPHRAGFYNQASSPPRTCTIIFVFCPSRTDIAGIHPLKCKLVESFRRTLMALPISMRQCVRSPVSHSLKPFPPSFTFACFISNSLFAPSARCSFLSLAHACRDFYHQCLSSMPRHNLSSLPLQSSPAVPIASPIVTPLAFIHLLFAPSRSRSHICSLARSHAT